jgi:hypothetical protein
LKIIKCLDIICLLLKTIAKFNSNVTYVVRKFKTGVNEITIKHKNFNKNIT